MRSDTLQRALAAFARKPEPAEPLAALSAGAFRAVIDERLRNLERQLEELKTRVNGLLFLIAGTVATQVIIRLFA